MSSTIQTVRRVGRYRFAAAAVLAAALLVAGRSAAPGGTARAQARPTPASIGEASSVEDVLDFAETSGTRWKTIEVRGHVVSGSTRTAFATSVRRPDASRSEEGSIVRVRKGSERLVADRANGSVVRSAPGTGAPKVSAAAASALEARMAVHRADDPLLSRPGEIVVDSPVNDLISPAHKVRAELKHTAVSVTKRGTATVAGREAVVLEARFPAELAKEDHWDVYVDVRTGIVLGLIIEPMAGNDRYESFIDEVTFDRALPDSLFDTSAAPAGGTR
ncbi:MAG TPA: hypothetical protein VF902_00940 [Coriobacteriia bacterium]